MKTREFLSVSFCLFLGSSAGALTPSEDLVFYPSYGTEVPGTQLWDARIDGQIDEPLRDPAARAEETQRWIAWWGLEAGAAENPYFQERVQGFWARPQRKRRLEVEVVDRTVALPPSDALGQIHGMVRLSTGPADPGPLIYFRRKSTALDPRHFRGELFLIPRLGVSVVVDLDTVLSIAQTADRGGMAAAAFLEPFTPLDGAPEVLAAWAEEGRLFHYISAVPRPLYGPLRLKMDESGFPPGVFHLRSVVPRGRGGKKFFRSGDEFKRETLERLFREFPDRRFVLVGDVFGGDPELFGPLGRAHLRQIEHIYIWDPQGGNRHQVRYEKAFQGVPPFLWSVAQNAGDLMR